MATTTNYGWTTPDDTALVKDGAAAIRTLGSSVDTTTKALNPSTTLGDIEYRSSTANTNTRLGIGTTGQVLSVVGGVPAWGTVSAGGMTLINTGGTTLTGASVSISSIPATYKDLQLVIRLYLPATDNVTINLRFNNDSTGVYYDTDTMAVYAADATQTAIGIGINNDNSVTQGLTIANIYDYANTTTYKVADSLSLQNNASITTSFNLRRANAFWKSTSAINRIDLLPNSGNFTSGTAFLYGVS
jgi:hypothetical protein